MILITTRFLRKFTRLTPLLVAAATTGSIFVFASPAQAACPGTIASGDAETSTQTLADSESCTIESGGSLTVTSGDAIEGNDDNTINIAGTITSSDDRKNAIAVNDNASITVSGTISTTGEEQHGIFAEDGADITITSTGSITGVGYGDRVINFTDGNTLINYGLLQTSGESARTINGGANNIIVNYGSIIATGDSDSSPAYAVAIFLNDNGTDTNTVTNYGLIEASGADAGTGETTYAIRFEHGNAILNIMSGSRIVGNIYFDANSTNVVNFSNAISSDFTFEVAPTSFTSNGRVSVDNGTQILVIDPSGFAMLSPFLGALTDSVLDTIGQNTGQAGASSSDVISRASSLGYTPLSYSTRSYEVSENRSWASVFGGYNQIGATSALNGGTVSYGGALAGMEFDTDSGTMGFYLGSAVGRSESDYDAQSLYTSSALAGVYIEKEFGPLWVNLSLNAGLLSFNQSRLVANNTSSTGVESAYASYDGWQIVPSLTVGVPLDLGVQTSQSSVLSARINYVGTFLDGYTESGVSSPLTVASSKQQSLAAQVQLAIPFEKQLLENQKNSEFELTLGAEGQIDIGSNGTSGTVTGTGFNFSDSFGDSFAGVIGLSFSQELNDGLSFVSASIEASSDFADDYGLAAQLKFTMTFP